MSSSSQVPVTLRDLFWNDPFFSTVWDDFSKMKEEMMKESQVMWSKFNEEMKNIQSNNSSSSISIKHEGNNQSKSMDTFQSDDKSLQAYKNKNTPCFFPRKWMMPSIFSEDMAKSFNLFQENDDQVIRIKDEKDKFEVSLDTHQYRPDELKVNVKDGVISIEAKHEEKSEDGNSFVSRQFSRRYTLPEECKVENVNSNLSSDGILVITAPKLKAVTDNTTRSIPIRKN